MENPLPLSHFPTIFSGMETPENVTRPLTPSPTKNSLTPTKRKSPCPSTGKSPFPVTPVPAVHPNSLLNDINSLQQNLRVMRDDARTRVEMAHAQARIAIRAANQAEGRASVYRRLFHEDADNKFTEIVSPLLDRIHSLEQELATIRQEQAENRRKTAEIRAMFDQVCGRRVTLQALMEIVEERAKKNAEKLNTEKLSSTKS